MKKVTHTLNHDSSSSEERSELLLPSENLEEGLDAHTVSGASSVRGRPKVPEQWTRLISFTHDDLDRLRVYELAPDLLLGN